jgi:hypothetical protein
MMAHGQLPQRAGSERVMTARNDVAIQGSSMAAQWPETAIYARMRFATPARAGTKVAASNGIAGLGQKNHQGQAVSLHGRQPVRRPPRRGGG